LAVLLLLNFISATKLRDIFDAYDEETKKEAARKDSEDNVDPVALAKEIGGSQIKREVLQATAGVADQVMLQLDSKINLDMT
jgi:hypothetical protein